MNKIFLIMAFVLCYVSKSKADAGCLVTGYGVFYNGAVASDPTTFFTSGSYYGNASQCSTSPSHTYYVLTGTSATACYAGYVGPGSNTTPSSYSRTGTKVTFNVAYCPIDDYAWGSIIVIGLVGFYFIKRENFKWITS